MSGGGPWTLPSVPTGASGTTPQDRATQVDRLYGRDLWFDIRKGERANYEITPTGDWKLAEGRVALRQAILRRILTDPGEWATLPDYGVGARMFVKGRNTRATRDELSERIRGQLLQDPRVERVDEVFVEIGATFVKIAVVVTPRGRRLRNEVVRASVEVS